MRRAKRRSRRTSRRRGGAAPGGRAAGAHLIPATGGRGGERVHRGCMTPCTAIDEISALPARRLGPGDALAIADMFLRLSDESRRRRFLSVKPYLTEQDLSRFTDVDHATCEAVGAFDD